MTSRKLKLVSKAPRHYRAGETLNLEGLHVFLVKGSAEPRELDKSEYTTEPLEGTPLSTDLEQHVAEQTVVVSYKSLTTSFKITIVNDYLDLLDSWNDGVTVYAGSGVPIAGLSAKFDSGTKTLNDPVSYLDKTYLDEGSNSIVASYTSMGVTHSKTKVIEATEPPITGITAIYDGGAIYPGYEYDITKLSASWKNALDGVAGLKPGIVTSGTYDHTMLGVERVKIDNPSQQQVKVWLLSDQSRTSYFRVNLISVINDLEIPDDVKKVASMWDRSKISYSKWLSDNVKVVDWFGVKSNVLSSDTLCVKSSIEEGTVISVPQSQVSVEVPVSVYVSRKYPEKEEIKTVSSTFAISAYRKLSGISAFNCRTVFAEGEKFYPGDNAEIKVGYSNGDVEKIPWEKLELSPATGTELFLGMGFDNFRFSYSETRPNPIFEEYSIEVWDSKPLVINPELIEDAIVIDPDNEHPYCGFFVGDSIGGKSECPAILSVRYSNGSIDDNLAVSSLKRGSDSFEFFPSVASFGLSSIDFTWKRTIVGIGESIINLSYPVEINYKVSGSYLSVGGIDSENPFIFYEDEILTEDKLSSISAKVVFGNGYELDVTQDIIDNLIAEHPVMSQYDKELELKFVLDETTEPYVAWASVIVIPKIIYEPIVDGETQVAQARFNNGWLEFGTPFTYASILDIYEVDGHAYRVVRLAEAGFMGCSDLVSIDFPSCLVEIGPSCFMNCESLEGNVSSVMDLAGISSLGKNAFSNCKNLSSVILPLDESVSALPDNVFLGTGLEHVFIPNNISSIGAGAFSDCSNLKDVKFPVTLSGLGIGAFENCDSIEKMDLSETKVEIISESCFANCDNLKRFLFSPYLTSIGDWAFHGCCSMSGVSIPEIDGIGEGAFENCSGIRTFTVTKVRELKKGSLAFYGMPATQPPPEELNVLFSEMSYAEIDDMYDGQQKDEEWTIGKYSFWTGFEDAEQKHLKDFEFRYNLQYVFGAIEGEESIVNPVCIVSACTDYLSPVITIPSRVRIGNQYYTILSVADDVFKDMTFITDVRMGTSVIALGNNVFEGCSNLSSVVVIDESEEDDVVPDLKLETLGDNAFASTSLSRIEVPNLRILGARAFAYTPIEEMDITNVIPPVGIFYSDWRPFYDCESLTSLSVGCNQLPLVNMTNTPGHIVNLHIVGNNDEIGNVIPDESLVGCTSLANLELSCVMGIGSNVFLECSNLTSIPNLNPGISLVKTSFAGLHLNECVVDSETGNMVFHIPDAVIDDDGTYELEENMLSIMSYAIVGSSKLKHLKVPEIIETVTETIVPRFLAENAVTETSMLSLTIDATDFGKDESGEYVKRIFANNHSLECLNTKFKWSATPRMFDQCEKLSSINIVPFNNSIGVGPSAFMDLGGLKNIELHAGNQTSDDCVILSNDCFVGSGLSSFIVDSNCLMTVSSDSENEIVLPKNLAEAKIPSTILTIVNMSDDDWETSDDFKKTFNYMFRGNSPISLSVDCGIKTGNDISGSITRDFIENADFTKDVVLIDAVGIAMNEFAGLTNLSSVKFVSSKKIYPYVVGIGAFKDCINLSSLDFEHTDNRPYLGQNCFAGAKNLSTISFQGGCPIPLVASDNMTLSTFRSLGTFNTGGDVLSLMVDNDYVDDWKGNFQKNFDGLTGDEQAKQIDIPYEWIPYPDDPEKKPNKINVKTAGKNINSLIDENDLWIVIDAGVKDVLTSGEKCVVSAFNRIDIKNNVFVDGKVLPSTSEGLNPSEDSFTLSKENINGNIIVQRNDVQQEDD